MKTSDTGLTDKEKYKLILFISGMSVKSVHAIENLHKICDTYLRDRVDLQIIDINHQREEAVRYQIIAVPTLIKTYPEPRRTIIGDLSDTQKVLKILDISE